ncbi:hypothetical protein R3F64_01170 [Halomonas sp. 5021]|uniref:hypothetical protein n=1 Tax=Halomonas sp. 5021 TaxID=3082156 RepID=UPI002FCC8DDA
MAQSDLNVANADGATVRADINSQLEALATQNSGPTAPPVTFPFMAWFDTANQLMKERNAANTGWRVTNLGLPIGSYLAVQTNIAGAEEPDPARFIKLTAGEDGVGGYNEGKLISETITGSAPLLVATAVIDDANSPMNGETVHLVNTENRYLAPGATAGAIANDQMQRITGSLLRIGSNRVVFRTEDTGGVFTADGGFDAPVDAGNGSNTGLSGNIQFDSANSPSARAGDHTNVKRIQATYYMRIK